MNPIIDYLSEEYIRRKKNNNNYSIRSFAKHLDLSPSSLSRILNGKQFISKKRADLIFKKLLCDPSKYQELMEYFDEKINCEVEEDIETIILKQEQYKLISNSIHYNILALLKCEKIDKSLEGITYKLKKSKREVEDALNRLLKLQMISFDSISNEYKKLKDEAFIVYSDFDDSSIKKSILETLEEGKEALFNIPLEKRYHLTFPYPVDLSQIQRAKEEFRMFSKKLESILKTNNSTEVYCLNIQFFPVTQ